MCAEQTCDLVGGDVRRSGIVNTTAKSEAQVLLWPHIAAAQLTL